MIIPTHVPNPPDQRPCPPFLVDLYRPSQCSSIRQALSARGEPSGFSGSVIGELQYSLKVSRAF